MSIQRGRSFVDAVEFQLERPLSTGGHRNRWRSSVANVTAVIPPAPNSAVAAANPSADLGTYCRTALRGRPAWNVISRYHDELTIRLARNAISATRPRPRTEFHAGRPRRAAPTV